MAYGYTNAFPDGDSFGLTRREYFAAHAPAVTDQQVIADVDGYPEFDNSGYFHGRPHATILAEQKKQQYEWLKKARIKWRWQYADMMITES